MTDTTVNLDVKCRIECRNSMCFLAIIELFRPPVTTERLSSPSRLMPNFMYDSLIDWCSSRAEVSEYVKCLQIY